MKPVSSSIESSDAYHSNGLIFNVDWKVYDKSLVRLRQSDVRNVSCNLHFGDVQSVSCELEL